MTRKTYIELLIRQINNGQPSDDSSITVGLVNTWLNGAIAAAAKQNYVESIKLDGVAYINGSFYSTFKDLAIIIDNAENFLYTLTLPQVPYALGNNEGISALRFKRDGQVSHPAIILSENQWARRESMRPIQNKIACCPQGDSVKISSQLPMYLYTANVTMVSPGLSSDLDSVIHVPEDYLPVIVQFVQTQLAFEKSRPTEFANDGKDKP